MTMPYPATALDEPVQGWPLVLLVATLVLFLSVHQSTVPQNLAACTQQHVDAVRSWFPRFSLFPSTKVSLPYCGLYHSPDYD
jgi:hypothetical protein